MENEMNCNEHRLGTRDHAGGRVAMDIKQPIKARITRRFSASPQHVFNAWLDSKAARKWLFARTGEIVCVEIDARAGGWFYIAARQNNKNVEYVGEYLEVIRPHRLVFMLLAEKYSLNFERVTVLFNWHGIGCEVGLTHETKPELAEQVRHDWIKLLERLAAFIDATSCHSAPPLPHVVEMS